MTTDTIKIDTRQYRRKHGHEPRGRFLWTFRFTGEKWYFTMRGEYAACLAAAVERAAARGSAGLSVSSLVYGQDAGR